LLELQSVYFVGDLLEQWFQCASWEVLMWVLCRKRLQHD